MIGPTGKGEIIVCIPVALRPTPPTDQSPCTQEPCLLCEKLMWVSEKKKALRSKNGYSIYCIPCVVSRVNNFEVTDIGKMES